MADYEVQQLPIIDVGPLLNPSASTKEISATIAAIGKACREVGFFYVREHGVDPSLERELEINSRSFFALQEEQKMQIAMDIAGRAWRK